MNKLKLGTLPLVITLLWQSACVAEDNRTLSRWYGASVSVSAGFKECSTDQDCVLVGTGCDSCCQTGAINKRLVDEFRKKFRDACDGYRGKVCDCAPAPTEPKCVKALCEATLKTEITATR